jgi:putative transposase
MISASAARGASLRHEHGSNFMAEHLQNQIRLWSMTPSYAFVSELEKQKRRRAVLLRV